jgi:hypothetical protein
LGNPEARVVAARARAIVAADRRAAGIRRVEPSAAAEDVFRASGGTTRIVAWRTAIIAVVERVLAPLPRVALAMVF